MTIEQFKDLSGIGLFVGTVYIVWKYGEKFVIKLIEKISEHEETKNNTYKDVIEDYKKREDTYLKTIDKFSEVLAENNKALIELSVQIENLGGRMADIENSMDRVNEQLGLPPIQKARKEIEAI